MATNATKEDGQERTSRSRSDMLTADDLLQACPLLDQNADLTTTMPFNEYDADELLKEAKISTEDEIKNNGNFADFLREVSKQIAKTLNENRGFPNRSVDYVERLLKHMVEEFLTTLVYEHFDYVFVDTRIPISPDDAKYVREFSGLGLDPKYQTDRDDFMMNVNRVFVKVSLDVPNTLQAVASMLVACQQILSEHEAESKTGASPSSNLGKLYAIHTNLDTWQFFEIDVEVGAKPMAMMVNGDRNVVFRTDPKDENFVKDLKGLYAMLHYICNDVNEQLGKTEKRKRKRSKKNY